MKKFRIVALGLILALVMPITAWASTYFAIGDSIAFGTGAPLTATSPYSAFYPLKGSDTPFYGYTDRFYEYLKSIKKVDTYVNASMNGMTSAQLAVGLNNLPPGLNVPTMVKDFITINIGANDLLAPLRTFVGPNSDITDLTSGQIALLWSESKKFNDNWNMIMTNLRKTKGSNATIIVNTVYNPFPVGSTLYFFASPFLANINMSIRNMAKTYGYKVADVKIAFDLLYSSKYPLVHFDLLDPVALHPTDKGYVTIYNLNKMLVPRR